MIVTPSDRHYLTMGNGLKIWTPELGIVPLLERSLAIVKSLIGIVKIEMPTFQEHSVPIGCIVFLTPIPFLRGQQVILCFIFLFFSRHLIPTYLILLHSCKITIIGQNDFPFSLLRWWINMVFSLNMYFNWEMFVK